MAKTKHPFGPLVKVAVAAETIAVAVRSNSSHCMIADAIRAAVPYAKAVSVDLSTCRFTDPAKGLRYVYLTPRRAQEALVDFDEGQNPQPFAFVLRGAHVSRAGTYERPPKGATTKQRIKVGRPTLGRGSAHAGTDSGVVPRRVGGKRPPQLHIRREFGLRAFRAASLRRLAAEAPAVVEGSEGDA